LKITQVLDPAHEQWVQGGTFKDLRNVSKIFNQRPIYIGSPFRTQGPLIWIVSCFKIFLGRHLLFSSLTPLVNYYRVYRFLPKLSKIGLWFTHQENSFSKSELLALSRCDVIFVHSLKQKKELEKIVKSKVEVMLGAIEVSRFKDSAVIGRRIVWVGTPNFRKNPDLLVSLAQANPNLDFLLLGKGWSKSPLMKTVNSLRNIEYREIIAPLTSKDFDGCDIYLCTSRIEGGPMPLLESLAAGLHPISTNVGFVEDLYNFFSISKQFIFYNFDQIVPLIDELRENQRKDSYILQNKITKLSFENLSNLIISHYK
jgi:glycosyltransferase involved in cell wall biosynthesis